MTNTKQVAELTDERKAFEHWYACNAFNYSRDPIGSRDCSLQWDAWKARALLSAQANDAKAQEDAIEHERDRLRTLQAERVMPMIGPLLDAFEGLPNDILQDEDTEELFQHLSDIRDAMNADVDAAIHAMQTGSGE